MALFQKGQPKIGGRRKGSRDKLSTALLEAIAKDFEEFGAGDDQALRALSGLSNICGLWRLCLPKEFEITDQPIERY